MEGVVLFNLLGWRKDGRREMLAVSMDIMLLTAGGPHSFIVLIAVNASLAFSVYRRASCVSSASLFCKHATTLTQHK
jgi:hypothetical protein